MGHIGLGQRDFTSMIIPDSHYIFKTDKNQEAIENKK
jgi:hypothetical protein